MIFHLKSLLNKTQTFLQRIRWKAHHYLKPTDNNTTTKETFGFKTANCAPPHADLKEFEDRILSLVQNIEFRNNTSEFQQKLARDIKSIKEDNRLFVPADKTTNFYRFNAESYQQLLQNQHNENVQESPCY